MKPRWLADDRIGGEIIAHRQTTIRGLALVVGGKGEGGSLLPSPLLLSFPPFLLSGFLGISPSQFSL